ncbi:MAG: sensor histidine kinase, partial [Parahaliea sp.]
MRLATEATATLNRDITHPRATSISSRQNRTLFRVYVAYRSLLSIVLLVMLVSPNTRQLVGGLNLSLYLAVAVAYVATSVVLMGSLSAEWPRNQRYLFLIFLMDIVATTLLSDASGGMISGLPILLIITVAASAVMISHRTLATLVAALSALAILLDTVRLIAIGQLNINALFPVGLLGLLLFGVSILVQAIAARLGRAEELARARASDLYNLQRLNEQIVQHMQTGILLVTANGRVRVMNKAASSLLTPERPVSIEQGRHVTDYSQELAQQFEDWRNSGLHRARPFQVHEDAPLVIANFREMQPDSEGETLVFLEDYTPVTQHAQALKLTSLGRLT